MFKSTAQQASLTLQFAAPSGSPYANSFVAARPTYRHGARSRAGKALIKGMSTTEISSRVVLVSGAQRSIAVRSPGSQPETVMTHAGEVDLTPSNKCRTRNCLISGQCPSCGFGVHRGTIIPFAVKLGVVEERNARPRYVRPASKPTVWSAS